jgi:hypothetical protein
MIVSRMTRIASLFEQKCNTLQYGQNAMFINPMNAEKANCWEYTCCSARNQQSMVELLFWVENGANIPVMGSKLCVQSPSGLIFFVFRL